MECLERFLKDIVDKRAALFIGSGISSLAGCLGSKEICSNLIKIKTVEQQLRNQNIEGISSKEIITFCQNSLSNETERKEFEGIMRGAITPDPDKFQQVYRPFIKRLKQIKPFPPILTTNIDSCLTDTKEFKMSRIYYELQDMNIDKFQNGCIFHIHGYKEDKSSQIWYIQDYPKRYENENFKHFLKDTFSRYSVLFLGYSFGDVELLQQITSIKNDITDDQNIIHYALIPTDNEHAHISEVIYEKIYNIKVIKYGERNILVDKLKDWIDSNFNVVDEKEEGDVSVPR